MYLRDLIEFNNKWHGGEHYDYGNSAPLSVLQYKPRVWEEDGIWHTALGALPDEAIWTLGSTLQESLEEFDKELQLSLQQDGSIKFLSQEELEKLHKPVWDKINTETKADK